MIVMHGYTKIVYVPLIYELHKVDRVVRLKRKNDTILFVSNTRIGPGTTILVVQNGASSLATGNLIYYSRNYIE